MEFVLAEELQVHQFFEEVSLPPPLIQGDESGAFPVEVGDSSGTDGNVLPSFGVGELHDLKVVRVLSFLQIAKFIAQAAFLLHQLNEVFGR